MYFDVVFMLSLIILCNLAQSYHTIHLMLFLPQLYARYEASLAVHSLLLSEMILRTDH